MPSCWPTKTNVVSKTEKRKENQLENFATKISEGKSTTCGNEKPDRSV